MNNEIFCGSKETMESIAKRGATGLNKKTMRYQIIDKSAQYEVKKTTKQKNSSLYSLFSNLPLRQIAEGKGLIL